MNAAIITTTIKNKEVRINLIKKKKSKREYLYQYEPLDIITHCIGLNIFNDIIMIIGVQ